MGPELLRYDVFLCFRGPDTRQGFTDVLYDYMVMAGLRVFRDDNELDVGDKIKSILGAIKVSEICVPVFSGTFPESKWCLDEVKSMVDSNKTIVPIFYKVSVNDVKLKTPRYEKFMKRHEKTHEVGQWKAALEAATENKGQELLKIQYTNFCNEFTNQVLKKLGPRERVHADDLIGVEDQLMRLEKLLDVDSSGTIQYICIHGMGGIGKTALSKVIFNKFSSRFDCWKFIHNVRDDCSRDPNWLGKLKKELESNLGGRIQEKKKVLIVLDDVDECEQIQELAGQHNGYRAGSVIIVTTREEDILCRCNILADGKLSYLRWIFYSRLPLSLIVMGSHLRGQNNKEIWEEAIERSKDILHQDVKKVLKISYDKLDYDQQQIFLDLACLPIYRNQPSRMMAMWSACNFYPFNCLPVLRSKSLIKIKGINWNDL